MVYAWICGLEKNLNNALLGQTITKSFIPIFCQVLGRGFRENRDVIPCLGEGAIRLEEVGTAEVKTSGTEIGCLGRSWAASERKQVTGIHYLHEGVSLLMGPLDEHFSRKIPRHLLACVPGG